MGLDDRLVSVTFECDVPARAKREKPWAIRSAFEDARDDAAATDRRVRENTTAGSPLSRLDEDVLRDAKPDVILTRSLCAASHAQVAEAKRALGYAPKLIEVSPARLTDVADDARDIARAAGAPGAGDQLANDIKRRIDAVGRAVAHRARPRVVFLEWSDPPMPAGDWIPDMLDAAGLHDPLGQTGAKSAPVSWSEVHAARPHAIIVAPCGFGLDRSVREAARIAHEFPRLPIFAFDAARYFARSGPSVATGVEMLAHAFHPAAWRDDPDPPAWKQVQ